MHAHKDTKRPGDKVAVNMWLDRTTRAKLRLVARASRLSMTEVVETIVAALPAPQDVEGARPPRYSDREMVVRFLKKYGRVTRQRLMRATHLTAVRLDEAVRDLVNDGAIEVVPNEALVLTEYALT